MERRLTFLKSCYETQQQNLESILTKIDYEGGPMGNPITYSSLKKELQGNLAEFKKICRGISDISPTEERRKSLQLSERLDN